MREDDATDLGRFSSRGMYLIKYVSYKIGSPNSHHLHAPQGMLRACTQSLLVISDVLQLACP